MFNETTLPALFNNTTITMAPATRTHIDTCSLPRENLALVSFLCLIIFIPITFIGNALVVFVILASRSLRKQSTFLFLASLAVTDTLISLIMMPLNAKIQWNSGRFCMSKTFCWIYLFVEPLLSITSVVHLFVISIDRYVSIKYVYRYNTMMTRKRVYLVILGIWLFSIVLSLIGIGKWESSERSIAYRYNSERHNCASDNPLYFTSIYVGCFVIPLIIMLYTYSYIYGIAVKHIKDIAKIEVNCHSSNDRKSIDKTRERKRKKRQFRTLRSIVIVFIVYFFCWFPTIVYILSIFYAKEFWRRHQHSQWFVALNFILILFLPPLNSTTNPFIYVLCNKQFRRVCSQLFSKLIGHREKSIRYVTTSVTDFNQSNFTVPLCPSVSSTLYNKDSVSTNQTISKQSFKPTSISSTDG